MPPPSQPPTAIEALVGVTSFPQLTVSEILEQLYEIDLLWVTTEDINKPTYHSAQSIFLKWIETLNHVGRDDIEEQAERLALEQDHGELYKQALFFTLFYQEVRILMKAAQVHNFTSQDLLKPQPKKFKKHMSALVNFHRFRLDRLEDHDVYQNEAEEFTDIKSELVVDVDRLREAIRAKKEQLEDEAPRAQVIREECQTLSDELVSLKSEQTEILKQRDVLNSKKANLVELQMALQTEIRLGTDKLRRLQSRIVTSPKELKNALTMLNEELREGKAHFLDTQRKAKDLDARVALAREVEEDLNACQSLMVSLAADQNRLDLIHREVRSLDADDDGLSSAYSQVSQTVSANSRQLENGQKRWERMRKTLEEKREMWKKREEEWTKRWETVEGEMRKRSGEAGRKQAEGRQVEREIEAELRNYDFEISQMVKHRNDLVRLAETYMESISSHLDLDGEGLVVDTSLCAA